MKVKLSKTHVLGKTGDTVEVSDARANYLKRVGAIKEETKKKSK